MVVVVVVVAAGTAGAGLLPSRPAGATDRPATVTAAAVTANQTWTQTLNDAGNPIALSSPNVANLDGQPAVVVGDRAGGIYAYHLSDGSAVAGWPATVASQPIDSPPSVAGSTVYVGAGNANTPTGGGYYAFSGNGKQLWSTAVAAQPGSTTNAGVITGLSVGALQGITSVVSGSLGQYEDELNAANGSVNGGFPWFEADSNYTTPAIADLYGNGTNEIIEGGDSTAGNAYNKQYGNGGHLRVLAATGNGGTGNVAGGLDCDYDTDQVVQSSPAVGTFLGGGNIGIAFGTGAHYANAATTNQLLAVDKNCQLAWSAALDGSTADSPALVDALGNGGQQIAEGTDQGVGSGGSVYLLNGANGGVIWRVAALGRVIGSITSADFGEGYQDLVVPSTGGLQILDGKTGATVFQSSTVDLQSSPLITDDPGGKIGITTAGYNGANKGEIVHYSVAGSNGALVNETGAWPQFHHDPQLTGDAGTPPPVVQVACSAPASPHGYDLFASDGGVFSYGNAAFCGSTGNITLNAPVTAGQTTSDAGGYWEVATDGGVFAFGDAPFVGAASSYHPAAPIVGIAASPSGRGYLEVGSDGGVFAFGDARYEGSAAPYHPAKPIVGIAATADGQGYDLVASDGGVFAFGDAHFAGSAGNLRLVRPVVGIATDPATGGYWLTATDGGLFAYDAPFYGSEGGAPLTKPVVGIAATPAGQGYRLVASDGGVFSFHAVFYGSAGNLQLARPVVGMSSTGT